MLEHFFDVFIRGFPLKVVPEICKRGAKLRSMLDLVLGGVLEASWSDLGRVFGGQDAPKTAQDGAKTAQDGAKTSPRRPQMAPRRP